MKNIFKSKIKVLVSVIIGIIIGLTISAYAVTSQDVEWPGTDWIVSGDIISAENLKANLDYLYQKVNEENGGTEGETQNSSNTSINGLVIYSAGSHNGNLGGLNGIQNKCDVSKPIGVKNVHGFISIDDDHEIRDLPTNYGYATNVKVYGKGVLNDIDNSENYKIDNDWNGLLDGSIHNTLGNVGIIANTNEWYWWSGSNNHGGLWVACHNWTDAGQEGFEGRSTAYNGDWLANSDRDSCSYEYQLLCIGEL